MTPASSSPHDDFDDLDGVNEFVSESEWQSGQGPTVSAGPAAPPSERLSPASGAPSGSSIFAPPAQPLAARTTSPEMGLARSPAHFPIANLPPEPVAPSRPDLTLDEVIGYASPLEWHEAVAFVREYLLTANERSLCDPASTLLTASGELRVLPEAVPLTHPARAAAELLVKLLPADTPPSLQALAAEEAGPAPRRRTPQELAQALAFFERPNRQADLAALWARADAGLAQRRSERALARLRREAQQPIELPPLARQRPWWSWRDIWAQNYALGAVLFGILAVGSSAWLLVSLSGGRSRERLPARSLAWVDVALPAAPFQAQMPDSARRPVTAEPPGAAAPSSLVGGKPSASVPAATAATSPPPSPVPSSGVAAAPDASRQWEVTLRELVPDRGVTASAPPAVRQPASRSARPPRIYTSDDDGITPASLEWPRMELDVVESGASTADSVLRLTIDERGRVERLRLLSPGSSFNDRMLLSAAKAWVFHPARFDGRPVKYQLDVRLSKR